MHIPTLSLPGFALPVPQQPTRATRQEGNQVTPQSYFFTTLEAASQCALSCSGEFFTIYNRNPTVPVKIKLNSSEKKKETETRMKWTWTYSTVINKTGDYRKLGITGEVNFQKKFQLQQMRLCHPEKTCTCLSLNIQWLNVCFTPLLWTHI